MENDKGKQSGQETRTPNTTASLILIGSELVGFSILGIVIDQFCGTTPWLTLIGIFLALAVTFWHGYVVLTRDEKKS